MSHARPRLGRHSLVLAIVMLLVGATGANAETIVTFSGVGAERTATVNAADGLSHELQFRITSDGNY